MAQPLNILSERQVASLAKKCRKRAGKTRAQAARDMRVAQASIYHAEERPGRSLGKLRKRMIEAYSEHRVIGPVYILN